MVTDGAEGEFGDTLSVPFRSILGEQNEETLHEKNHLPDMASLLEQNTQDLC